MTETCNIVREAITAVIQHNEQVQSPEQLKPSNFAPVALWYIMLKKVFERANQVNPLIN